ncbi:MAG: mechanosensitive ion channel [Sulfolobaceae archaeon]
MQTRIYIKLLIMLVILGILDYLVTVILKILAHYYPSITEYSQDITTGFSVVIIAIGGFYIIRVLQRLIFNSFLVKLERSTASTIKIILDILFYTILVMVILAALKVNLTGVLVGGAVGGIIIGLAVQTIAQNLLSGLLVTTTKTVKPNDAVSLVSWIWGFPVVGEITKVSILFTEIKTTNGIIVRIPNSAFLGNTIFQKLESENSLIYPYQLLVNADVSANELLNLAKSYIQDSFSKNKLSNPEIYFTGKNGTTNAFTVILHFEKIEQLNTLLNLVNEAFEKAYWELKKKA